jgi:hypothetical protein
LLVGNNIPLSGYLSDRIGRKKMYIIGAATMGVFGFIYFALIDTGSSVLISKFLFEPLAKLHADPVSPIVFNEDELAISDRRGDFSKYAVILGKIFVQRLSAPKYDGIRTQT